MNKRFFFLLPLCAVLCGCENRDSGANNANLNTRDQRDRSTIIEADNTGRNARDRGATLTPTSQSENELDRSITQKIRQSVIDEGELSTNAKNVKIITTNGVVTLRGVVNNDSEKNELGRKARSISGVRNVDNQLEVIRNAQSTR
jgi:hyperosmotically inducible periplasmic protein